MIYIIKQGGVIVKKNNRFFLIIIIMLVFGGCYSADPSLDLNFYFRYLSFPRERPFTTVSWYKPKEIVHGSVKGLESASKDKINVLEDYLDKISYYSKKHNSTGLLVLHEGKIVLEEYWQGNNQKSTTDSASMSKTLTALLIGVAIDEGKIHSEDELAVNYLPEWKNDSRKKITIKNLLQMNSGLRNDDRLTTPFSDLVKMHIGFNLTEYVLSIPAIIEPGTKYEYNNANSQILGIILERVTGKKYHEYLSEKIWKPLGSDDATVWLDHPGGIARTYCCFFSTLQDWGKVGLMLMNNGNVDGKQIIPQGWLKKMLIPSKLKPIYGYQIWIGNSEKIAKDRISEPFLANDVFFLDGKGKQRVYIIPSKKLVIVRVGEGTNVWDESYLINNVIRGLKFSQARK